MLEKRKILIVGGGIGGLASAIALRRQGMDAEVYEQANELREIGAGLSVWPNATWVLEKFALLPRAIERGSRLQRVRLQTSQGKMLAATTAVAGRRTPSLGMHRVELLALLNEALPSSSIFLGMRFRTLEESREKISALFDNGHRAEGDALIGADGLYSRVRETILGAAAPTYRGYQAWRGVSNFPLPENLRATTCETWGAGSRFGFGPIGASRSFWYATKNAPEGTLGDPVNWKAEVARVFRGWPAPISEIVEATPDSSVLKHEIFDRPPRRQLGQGRATLLGDAGNPTTPNLGQGACLALEDAYVLAECLSNSGDMPEALREYETRRYARRRFITYESRRIGWLGQRESAPGVALRNLLVAMTSGIAANLQHRRYYAFLE